MEKIGDTMSDNEQTEQQPEQDNSAIKQMREAMGRKDDEIAGMRSQLVAGHLKGIGLQADVGLGKAIAQGYEGDISAEAIAAYAKSEYSHEPVVQENTQAAQMQQTQQRVDQFGSASGSIQPTSQEDLIAAHNERMRSPEATRKDANASIEAKLQHYVDNNL